jgi:hypothetical protein
MLTPLALKTCTGLLSSTIQFDIFIFGLVLDTTGDVS